MASKSLSRPLRRLLGLALLTGVGFSASAVEYTDHIYATDFNFPKDGLPAATSYTFHGAESGIEYLFKVLCTYRTDGTVLIQFQNNGSDIGVITKDNPRGLLLRSVTMTDTYGVTGGINDILFLTSEQPFTGVEMLYDKAAVTTWDEQHVESGYAQRQDYEAVPAGDITRFGIRVSESTQIMTGGLVVVWDETIVENPVTAILISGAEGDTTYYPADGVGSESQPLSISTADYLTLRMESAEGLSAVITDGNGNERYVSDVTAPIGFDAAGEYILTLYRSTDTADSEDTPAFNPDRATRLADIHIKVTDVQTVVSLPNGDFEEEWYDLQGRKIYGLPGDKGLYIRRTGGARRLHLVP